MQHSIKKGRIAAALAVVLLLGQVMPVYALETVPMPQEAEPAVSVAVTSPTGAETPITTISDDETSALSEGDAASSEETADTQQIENGTSEEMTEDADPAADPQDMQSEEERAEAEQSETDSGESEVPTGETSETPTLTPTFTPPPTFTPTPTNSPTPTPSETPTPTPEVMLSSQAVSLDDATEASLSSSTIYTIRSAINRNYVFDIAGGKTDNKTKLQLYRANGTDAQKFKFTKNSDGTYTITNVKSKKALDIPANSSANKVQFQIYTSNGTNAQKFRVYSMSDGSIVIQNVNGKVFDVSGGKATNKRKIQTYTFNDTAAQHFFLEEVKASATPTPTPTKKPTPTPTPTPKVYSGTYIIKSASGSGKVFDISGGSTASGANLQMYTANQSLAQVFGIESLGNGYYRIRSAKSNYVLDVAGGKTANGTNVRQYLDNGSTAQQWRIIENKDGTITFASRLDTSKVLDIKGGSTANKANVQIYSKNGTSAQKFTLTPFAASTMMPSATGAGSAQNLQVLLNIIGAVESGGQIYGNRNYSEYVSKANSVGAETTITIGWPMFYGNNARSLMQTIFNKGAAAFRKIDKNGAIEAMLTEDWTTYNGGWEPSAAERATIISLISSENGKKAQDEYVISLLNTNIAACEASYTKSVPAVMMYCEIRHLGGKSAADRIFKKLKNDYSLTNIMNTLKLDQADLSNNNQVGDTLYWSRHTKCKEFIEKYAFY